MSSPVSDQAATRYWRAQIWLWAGVLALALSGAMAEGLVLTEEVFEWAQRRYGDEARRRVEGLRDLVRGQGHAAEREKLARVNDFFNAIPYGTDMDLWGEEDYWATPVEMLGIRGADCEDYAIAKYFALREMGVQAERLRITYVKAITLNQAHMVLAYYPQPEAEPVILDNLSEEIQPAGERSDLVPVYSFNGENLWLAISRSRGEKVGGADRIKLWNKLRSKMERERSK